MRLAPDAGMANPKADQLKARTKRFALDILSFRRTLPVGDEAADIGRQLSRAATAVAANYRSACRSRSDAEFAASDRSGVGRSRRSSVLVGNRDGASPLRFPPRNDPPGRSARAHSDLRRLEYHRATKGKSEINL